MSTRAVLDGAPSRMLTWNPKHWEWSDLPKIVEQLRRGIPVEQQWSCGNARSIAIGTRVFMLRQGVEPKGIIASGWVTTAPFEAPHWSAERAAVGDTAYCIKFTPDTLIDPSMNAPLDVRAFQSGPVTTVQLDAPASGNSIPDSAASALEEAWAAHLNAAGHGLGFAEAEFGAFEGEQKRRFVMHRSRERALREAKIAQARSRAPDGRIHCEVPGCGFDFEAAYGELGAGYAQVHHLLPLSASGVVWKGLDDLAVVCANCHAMIHRGGACRPLESLRRPISP